MVCRTALLLLMAAVAAVALPTKAPPVAGKPARAPPARAPPVRAPPVRAPPAAMVIPKLAGYSNRPEAVTAARQLAKLVRMAGGAVRWFARVGLGG